MNGGLELLPPRLQPVVVVGTADTSVPESPVATLAGPILFEPRGSSLLTVLVQPLHKLALKDIAEGNRVAASGPHQQLVPCAVDILILEVLDVRLLLPSDSCGRERSDAKQLLKLSNSVTCEMRRALKDLALEIGEFRVNELGKLCRIVT